MIYNPKNGSHQYAECLEELIGCSETADSPKEVLLVFRDRNGGQLALRLLRTEIDNVVEKLGTCKKQALGKE